ncbi:splicing factor 3B subunit 1-like isoform X1 [Solanum pennellii]|uniref:Splicing factor 3B subunit 1-like isoform X1 n=1 Tax=Solanum pennellii TaxID=28526 RepID=A0ABM1UWH2_SOLPN|nr:splicing factor 3B subunit 1-like isoform X1 [Solanum pennellii]
MLCICGKGCRHARLQAIAGREIISDLSKAAGIDAMIHVTRLNIDSPNEYIRNAAARSLSIVASALGIPALLPFLEEICFKMESWEARHTGVMIVYHITVLIGSANLLPYLSYLMEIVEPRLKDDIEKIRDVTNVAMDALAIAATLWY